MSDDSAQTLEAFRHFREKMNTDKYEAKSKAYLQEIRKAAMIEYR